MPNCINSAVSPSTNVIIIIELTSICSSIFTINWLIQLKKLNPNMQNRSNANAYSSTLFSCKCLKHEVITDNCFQQLFTNEKVRKLSKAIISNILSSVLFNEPSNTSANSSEQDEIHDRKLAVEHSQSSF